MQNHAHTRQEHGYYLIPFAAYNMLPHIPEFFNPDWLDQKVYCPMRDTTQNYVCFSIRRHHCKQISCDLELEQ